MGTEVYVVTQEYYHEGSTILGVCSNRERALQCAARAVAADAADAIMVHVYSLDTVGVDGRCIFDETCPRRKQWDAAQSARRSEWEHLARLKPHA